MNQKQKLSLSDMLHFAAVYLSGKPIYFLCSLVLSISGMMLSFLGFLFLSNSRLALLTAAVERAPCVLIKQNLKSHPYFTDRDLERLGEQYSFASSDDVSFYSMLEDKSFVDRQYSYYTAYSNGAAYLTETQLKSGTWTMKGTLPVEKNEIALTSYLAETILISNGGTEESLIGQPFVAGGQEYRISGIVDTGFSGKKYAYLRERGDDLTLKEARRVVELAVKLQEEISNGPHAFLFLPASAFEEVEQYKYLFSPMKRSLRKEAVLTIIKAYPNPVTYDGDGLSSIDFYYADSAEQKGLISSIEDHQADLLLIAAIVTVLGLGITAWFESEIIEMKKSSVGILRALGGSKQTTRNVFLVQLCIIGLIVFLGATISGLIVFWIINAKALCPLLIMPVWVIPCVLALCLAVSLLSGWIPVARLVKRQPIEILQKAKE